MAIAAIFSNFYSSYRGRRRPAKESFMIVRFLWCHRNLSPTFFNGVLGENERFGVHVVLSEPACGRQAMIFRIRR
jgi:hypothetical protein